MAFEEDAAKRTGPIWLPMTVPVAADPKLT